MASYAAHAAHEDALAPAATKTEPAPVSVASRFIATPPGRGRIGAPRRRGRFISNEEALEREYAREWAATHEPHIEVPEGDRGVCQCGHHAWIHRPSTGCDACGCGSYGATA